MSEIEHDIASLGWLASDIVERRDQLSDEDREVVESVIRLLSDITKKEAA